MHIILLVCIIALAWAHRALGQYNKLLSKSSTCDDVLELLAIKVPRNNFICVHLNKTIDGQSNATMFIQHDSDKSPNYVIYAGFFHAYFTNLMSHFPMAFPLTRILATAADDATVPLSLVDELRNAGILTGKEVISIAHPHVFTSIKLLKKVFSITDVVFGLFMSV